MWPIALLLFLEGILVGANYIPGTFLMGWDNVMPEFNVRQALMTNIFGVWQEHRGLGLPDGMGHAANLVHTALLWILSLTLPQMAIRYAFHFLMHLLGGIGAYILLRHLIKKDWPALAGAMFYLFNLATIQMFYTPLEAFSVHFAALPWLAWSLMGYLREGSRKQLFLFLVITLLSTPQFFIPTLLLPTGILLGTITIITIINGITKQIIQQGFCAAIGFLLINAFWLLPYGYGLPQNVPVIRTAKINQMSSEEVYERNRAFGGLADVLRLRGFPLDFEDTDGAGTTIYLMEPWRGFLTLPIVSAVSWLLVGLVILGFVSSIGVKKIAAANVLTPMAREARVFLLTGAVALLFLANDTPIVKELMQNLRGAAPSFAEAYRFPFTKFSLLLALSMSVLLPVGLTKLTKRSIGLTIALMGFILVLAYPAFRGNFFSDRLRVTLPDDYLRLFTFMKDKPKARMAYLPQHQYWSWKYYNWGYRGSGFVWYGLSQPLLDRAFDPWSGYNENYFWEISRSIYSKDTQSLLAVLRKYDVRYILLDEHIISPSHNRALYTEETKEALASLPQVREVARFGKLTVYETEVPPNLRIAESLPVVSPAYGWTDNDVAYRDVGDYITPQKTAPYEAALEARNDTETCFNPSTSFGGSTLMRGSCLSSAPIISQTNLVVKGSGPEGNRTPGTLLDRQDPHQAGPTPLSDYQTNANYTMLIYPFRSLFTKRSVNEREFTITETEDAITIGSVVEATSANILKSGALVYDSTVSADLVPDAVKPCGLLRNGTALATRTTDGALRFMSLRQRGCLSFSLGALSHRDAYLLSVESKHVAGRPLLFSLINDTARHVELETYLKGPTDYFILPPLAPDGLGYSVYIANDAIGRQETVNDLLRIRVYRLPYEEMVTLSSRGSGSDRGDLTEIASPNEATLILSQSFDPGWTAWEIKCTEKSAQCTVKALLPFLFGKKLNDHVLVNNWANGWRLQSDQSDQFTNPTNKIVVFFVPQLLEWLGLALLPIPFFALLFIPPRRPNHTLAP